MVLTFVSDNNVTVYALEKIICNARENRYIFVAQSVWWIASVIGLTEGLATHIDNLRKPIRLVGSSYIGLPDREEVIAPSDIPDRLNVSNESGHIHPDRILQIGKIISDGDSSKNSDSELGQASRVIKAGKEFIDKSRKERKSFRKNTALLTRTRSGNIPRKPLSRNQRNCLQSVSSQTLTAYLNNRN